MNKKGRRNKIYFDDINASKISRILEFSRVKKWQNVHSVNRNRVIRWIVASVGNGPCYCACHLVPDARPPGETRHYARTFRSHLKEIREIAGGRFEAETPSKLSETGAARWDFNCHDIEILLLGRHRGWHRIRAPASNRINCNPMSRICPCGVYPCAPFVPPSIRLNFELCIYIFFSKYKW